MTPLLVTLLALGAPCERAAYLTQGQPAPCDGNLLPSPTLAKLLDQSDALTLAKAELHACHQAASAKQVACDQQRAVEATRATAKDHDNHWWLWLLGGVAIGAVTALSIQGIK